MCKLLEVAYTYYAFRSIWCISLTKQSSFCYRMPYLWTFCIFVELWLRIRIVQFLADYTRLLAHEQTEVWVEHAACPHFQRKRKLWWAEQQVVGRRIRSSLEADTSARKNSIVPIGDDALTHACACDAGKAVRGRRRRSRSRRATWPTLIFNLWRKWRRRSSKWLFNAYRVLPYVPPVSIDHHRRWWRTGDGTVVGRP
jgi:hypothetical protein